MTHARSFNRPLPWSSIISGTLAYAAMFGVLGLGFWLLWRI